MERRRSSNSELPAIQKEIGTIELAVLEALAEVDDHFVSHLELQKEEDLWYELGELNKEWNNVNLYFIQKIHRLSIKSKTALL